MRVLLVEIIICESVVKLKKPTLEMIEPKIRILAQFRPDQAILQVIPHKKKSWETNYKKIWKPLPFLERSTKGSRYIKKWVKPLPFLETSEGDQGI